METLNQKTEESKSRINSNHGQGIEENKECPEVMQNIVCKSSFVNSKSQQKRSFSTIASNMNTDGISLD